MPATAVSHDPILSLETPGKPAFTASFAFHAFVVLLLIVGLPYVTPDLPVPQEPVPVEILDISELTQTTSPPARSESQRKPIEEAKKPPEEKPPVKIAPQVTAKAPPKPVAPTPPEEVIYPQAVATPPPPKKPQIKPKPQEKKPVLTRATEEEQQEDFQSLLRNLMPTEPEAAERAAESAQENAKPAPLASLADRMTISEQDALRRQLASCWSVLAGARYAEDIVVEIKLSMNPDRTIQQARIANQLRYNADSYFRAAADSALRALYNPRCNPLDLPPEKYTQWKEITVTFDPRGML
ncbi:MAG: energy transducer TonB [Alphaproteobacteria bacterium]|nr:energy transducer TonB [Alphaproteobacteria bacterium]